MTINISYDIIRLLIIFSFSLLIEFETISPSGAAAQAKAVIRSRIFIEDKANKFIFPTAKESGQFHAIKFI